MSGTRQPLEVVQANGRKHLTKAEIEKRQETEVKSAPPKQVRRPKWLPEKLGADFKRYADKLIALGIYSDLDADTLGRYLIAHGLYLNAVKHVTEAMRAGDEKAASSWTATQDKLFKQCRNCANDLGMTISARARLVVPEAAREQEEDDPTLMVLRRNA